MAVYRYRERSWPELLEIWVALNRQLAVVVEHVAAEKLETVCLIGGGEAVSLAWLMTDYLRHLKHCLAQLKAA